MNYQFAFARQRKFFVFLFAMLLLIPGCTRTVQVSFYQLSAVGSPPFGDGDSVISDSVLGIGPVSLPEYLDRPQMIVRLGANQLQLSDSHRWVEPLAENIPHVLRENLANLLHTEQLLFYPWGRDMIVSYQLVIDLVRFDGDGLDKGYLEAIWSIRDSHGKVLLPARRSSYVVKTPSPDHKGLATALSETLFLFCRDIAEGLSQKSEREVM